ncbi:hypothetical protein [Kribbella amoyensis]|nr:hypothetical protein [Kribbella amoyensis]
MSGGAAALSGRYLWDRRAARRSDGEELDQIRKLADEDVTLLGEELSRLDARVAGHPLDGDARVDYQVALDSYEAAQRAVHGIRRPEAISAVTDALATGRYAIVCVQARVAGRPVPERRVPCFFNPQHGPSVTDVVWTQPKHGTRTVPACAQDAARVKAGEEPELRYMQYAGRRVPYWEAGAAVAPYGKGYFASGAGATYAALSFDNAVAGSWVPHPGGGHGAHGHGGFDGGGGDLGGGHGGGHDYGGGGHGGGHDFGGGGHDLGGGGGGGGGGGDGG